MNLKHYTDQDLHERTGRIIEEERERLTFLLHHLREIECRRLYSLFKYSSITAYLVGEFNYPSDQAERRITAMHLLRDVPEVEEKVTNGSLSLTNMILAQALFSKEKKAGRILPAEQKIEILEQLENQTTREAQKIVCAINPDMKPRSKPLDFDSIEDISLLHKLNQVRGLYAHQNPNLSLMDLLHKLCDNELKKKAPAAPRVGSKAEIKRQVWRRDNNKCTNCGSTYAVQIDHIIPKAAGGLDTYENMRLLCRSCNQRAAIQYFGEGKMGKYLKSPHKNYFL